MSPFDISVIMFLMVMVIKILVDTRDFWKEIDAAAAAPKRIEVAPRHLPAPSRPSPKKITPVPYSGTVPARRPAKIQPIRREAPSVRPARIASATKSIRPVSAPIKKTTASTVATSRRKNTVA